MKPNEPNTFSLSAEEAARLLRVDASAIALSPDTHFTAQQVLLLNEQLKQRVRSELAGNLIDRAYALDIEHGADLAQVLDECLARVHDQPKPQSALGKRPPNSIGAIRGEES